MVLSKLKSARKHGVFVQEMQCPCPDNQLKAIKFTKVKTKYTDEAKRKLCWFLLAIFSIILFVLIAFLASAPFLLYSNIWKIFSFLPEVTPVILWIIAVLSNAVVTTLSILLCCHKSYFECKHTALEVLFNCDSCGHNMHKTYECFIHSCCGNSRNKTYCQWGRYRATNVTKTVLQQKPTSATMITFEMVEREFNVMSSDQQKNNYTTSWAWINDLKSRLD